MYNIYQQKSRLLLECDCQRAAREKQQAAESRQKHLEKVEDLKRRGFTDPAMRNWTFEHDNGRNPQTETARFYVESWETMQAENIDTGPRVQAGTFRNGRWTVMAVPVAALAKIAAAALSDEDTRRKLGWIVAAICSPLILTLALICSLLSGSAEHNNSAVLLCFNGGNIPGKTPAEYVAYIEDMRRSFTLLDDAIAAVNDMTENSDSLDGIRVKDKSCF